MALNLESTVDIIETMENWMERIRPPHHIRPELDISYKIDKQSIILFEIRPAFRNPSELKELPFAKVRYVKSENIWKVYWMRSNLKWTLYEPRPQVKNLKAFIKLVDDDAYHCFKG
jgi:hypothetical protein